MCTISFRHISFIFPITPFSCVLAFPLPSYTPHNSNGKLRNFPFGNFHCRVLLSNFTEWFKFPRTLPAWLAGPGLYNWYVGRLVSRINTTTQHTRNTVSWGRHSYTEAQLISWSLVLIAHQMATYGWGLLSNESIHIKRCSVRVSVWSQFCKFAVWNHHNQNASIIWLIKYKVLRCPYSLWSWFCKFAIWNHHNRKKSKESKGFDIFIIGLLLACMLN